MDEIKKQGRVKDLSMIIIETNLIGIDFSEHIRVLIQNLDHLKSDICSRRMETVHLNLLLRELKTNIEKLLTADSERGKTGQGFQYASNLTNKKPVYI